MAARALTAASPQQVEQRGRSRLVRRVEGINHAQVFQRQPQVDTQATGEATPQVPVRGRLQPTPVADRFIAVRPEASCPWTP